MDGGTPLLVCSRITIAIAFAVATVVSAEAQEPHALASRHCPPPFEPRDIAALRLDSTQLTCVGGSAIHLFQLALARGADSSTVATSAMLLGARIVHAASTPADSTQLGYAVQYLLFALNHGNVQARVVLTMAAFKLYEYARGIVDRTGDCVDARSAAHYFRLADEFRIPDYAHEDGTRWFAWRREVTSLVQQHCEQ